MIKKQNKGFTLMEVLIYTAILSVTGTILSGVLLNTTKIKGRQTAVIEVNEQLNFVLQKIQRSIMDSSIIDIENSVSTSTLVLRYKDESKNPTRFYVSDNIVYKKEAANTPQPLTDSSVIANAINFLKVSGYSGHDSLQIDLTLSYNTNNPVSAFSRTLSSAIARVSAATFDSDLIPGSSIHDLGTSGNKWRDLYISRITNFGGVSYTWPAADGTNGQNLSTNGLGVLSWATPAGYWSALGNNIYNTNTGNVGIGTTTPTSMLTIGGASGTIGLSLQGNNLSCTVYPCIRTGGGGSLQIDSSTASGAFGKLYLNNTKNSDVLIAVGGGSVGVGTTTPSSLLHLYSISTSGTQLQIQNADTGGTSVQLLSSGSGNDEGAGAFSILTGGSRRLTIESDGGVAIGTYAGGSNKAPANGLTISGNVGIGTISPNSTLQVTANKVYSNGYSQILVTDATTSAKQLELGFDGTNNIAWLQGRQWSVGYMPLTLNPSGGNVGIGTTEPSSLLHVQGSTPNFILKDTNGSVVGGTYGQIEFRTSDNSMPTGIAARIDSYDDSNLYGDRGALRFYTNPSTVGVSERMRITSQGNVGIGTTAPGYKLEINGNFKISGTGSPTAGGALCLNASNVLSKCTSTVDAYGNCTCP